MKKIIPEKKEALSQAWTSFCDNLKEAGSLILKDEVPDTELDVAEGYRYLSRLASLGLDMFIEEADPERPRILWGCTTKRKPMFLNPDQTYHSAPVRGDLTYRLTGTFPRGTGYRPLLEVQTWSGKMFASRDTGDRGKDDIKRADFLLEEDISFNEDGSFEIIIGPDRREGNWLKTDPDTSMVLVRQYITDWEKQVPWDLHIEKIDGPAEPFRLTPDYMARGLNIAGLFTLGVANRWLQWVDSYRMQGKVNDFPRWIDPEDEYATRGVRYRTSRYEIAPGEALIIEFEDPKTPYWGFTLTNFWLEVGDWHHGERASLNNDTAHVDDDGWVRIVIAPEDPGVKNWMPTQGHYTGMYTLRWARRYDWEPKAKAALVKIEDIPERLK